MRTTANIYKRLIDHTGKPRRTEVLGIPTLTTGPTRQLWDTHGPAVMYSRLSRIEQQFKLADTRHKRGATTDDQFNRALSRINARLRNIQYWTH